MASGGTWQTQNKIRGGAYINVVGKPKSVSRLGERGTIAIAAPLDWGGQVVEIQSQQLINGEALKIAGISYFDQNASASSDASNATGFNVKLALQGAKKAVIYRSNLTSSTKASASVELESDKDLTVTAKYNGAFGNRISASLGYNNDVTPPLFTLKTYIDGELRSSTESTEKPIGDDFVDLVWPELSSSYDFVELNDVLLSLSGGTSAASSASYVQDAITYFDTVDFNVFIVPDTTKNSIVSEAVKSWREDQGKKVQAVLYDYAGDNEGVICLPSGQGYKLSDATEVFPIQTIFTVGGMTAGASVTQSLSGDVIPDAVEITGTGPRSNAEIINALKSGKYVFSRREGDGAIVLEKDINSLHTFTPDHGYVFSKQRPLRVMDTSCNDIKLLWVTSYLGKVNNDNAGRAMFKADVISYFKNLETIGAIQNFVADDVSVEPGEDVDSVVVFIGIQPVDSMEKLYAKITVEG